MAMGIEQAYFLAMVLAAAFYGIFLVLYCGIVYIIFFHRKDPRSKKSAPFIIVTVMLLVATVHLGVTYVRARTALLNKLSEPGGALAYLEFTATGSYMFQDTIYGFQTLMADAFIVYRLYIVYAKDKRVVLPACGLFLGCIAVSFGSLIAEGTAKPGSNIFTPRAWVTTFFVLTLLTNFSCTGLIAYKIWSVKDVHNPARTSIAVTVIESGALYSASLIAFLATYVRGDWTFFIPFILLVHVIGIAFSLIMIRVGLGISIGDPATTTIVTISSVVSLDCDSIRSLPNFSMAQTTQGSELRRFGLDTIPECEASIEKASEDDYKRRSRSSSSSTGGDLEEQKTAALQ